MATVYLVKGKTKIKEDRKETTPDNKEKKQGFLAKDLQQEVIIMSNIYFPSVRSYF